MPRRNNKQQPKIQRFQNTANCDAKKRYKTEAEAETAREHQELLHMGLKLRVYACNVPGCQGWHLTREG